MHNYRPIENLDRSLRCFLRIAQLGSVSKAADDLGQSQSSLSKQLSALEQNLGQALFISHRTRGQRERCRPAPTTGYRTGVQPH